MTSTRKWALALSWALAFGLCSVSRADTVSVPLGNGLSVTVTTGKDAPVLEQINNNAMSTNVTMADDSFVTVPLPFTFTYWGQEFTTSRMYSNGVINFTSAGVPANYCCDGQNLATLSNTAYNYSIMPLWTDLIAQNGGSHYVLSTTSAVTYGWYSVSEFGTNNRSSFEVKIDATGLVDIRFSEALVERGVTSGLTGDLAQGQYYQYHHGGMLTISALGWSLPGTTVVTPDPCAQALTTPGCPGFVGTATADVVDTSISDPVPTASSTTAAPATASGPLVPVVPTTLSSRVGESAGTRAASSANQVLGIVRGEQSRVNAAETQVLDQSAAAREQAVEQSVQTATPGISAASNSSRTVNTGEREAATISRDVNTMATRGPDSTANTTDPAAAIVNPGLALPGMRDTAGTAGHTDTAASGSTVNRRAADNEVAGGVDITQLARAPSGFAQYQLGMPDGQGYQPKEIYRNQTVIDNQRLLRGLTGATDRVHQEMMQQQYR